MENIQEISSRLDTLQSIVNGNFNLVSDSATSGVNMNELRSSIAMALGFVYGMVDGSTGYYLQNFMTSVSTLNDVDELFHLQRTVFTVGYDYLNSQRFTTI